MKPTDRMQKTIGNRCENLRVCPNAFSFCCSILRAGLVRNIILLKDLVGS